MFKEAGNQTDYVYLAEGYNKLVDALAIGPVSVKRRTPVLLTKTDGLPEETEAASETLGVGKVIIIGGTGAISKAVETQLEEANCEIEARFAGDDRYETALEIAREYFKDSSEGIIARNDNSKLLADGLVGGYLGAKKMQQQQLRN